MLKTDIQKEAAKHEPRVLLYDIETSPNIGAYFELYREGNILWNDEHWHILSVAWKWLGGSFVGVKALPDYPGYKKNMKDDRALVSDLWNLMNTADIVIAHNGAAFDTKKTCARFMVHGMKPPRPYKEVDTKLVAKRYFRFDSNKLDDIADYLGVGRKMEHGGISLWKKVLAGDRKAWETMKAYNKHDVVLLEKIYIKMLPYIRNHPNLALLRGFSTACPNCGSTKIEEAGVAHNGRVREQEQMRCLTCGAWSTRPLGGQVRQVR
jgi:hypothetical protein